MNDSDLEYGKMKLNYLPHTAPSATVRIKRLRDSMPVPSYGSDGAAGLDLPSAIDTSINPGDRRKIPTGWAFEIPVGFEGHIRSRSGFADKHGVTELSGTVDSDYRGEVHVMLVNLGREALSIRAGDRIAQMVISPVIRAELIESDELSTTERGANGFGSSGVGSKEHNRGANEPVVRLDSFEIVADPATGETLYIQR